MKKVPRRNIGEYAAEFLRHEITSGRIPPGALLAQNDIALELGTSRGPVREALQQLAREGLVETLDNRRIRVASRAKGHPAVCAVPAAKEACMTDLKPIELQPAREHIAAELRKAIVMGSLASGEQLTLKAVAEQLGVSKTPVREAFQMLAIEGLLEVRPNHCAVVRGYTHRSVSEHLQLDALLECEIVGIICRSEADLSHIEAICQEAERMMRNSRYEAYQENNQAFHRALWDAADNHRMRDLLESMWCNLPVAYYQEHGKQSIHQHLALLEALRARDEEQARQMMRGHVFDIRDTMLNILVGK